MRNFGRADSLLCWIHFVPDRIYILIVKQFAPYQSDELTDRAHYHLYIISANKNYEHCCQLIPHSEFICKFPL